MKTRATLAILMAMTLAAVAFAAQDPTSNRFDPGPKGQGDGATNPRTGGDTIPGATVIPSLPYHDTGATCGFVQDYSDCVYNTGAPDVVYAYTPVTSWEVITISLCGSGYDTALWVYAGGGGNTVACNDDFCGLQSEIRQITVTGGVTYYIVVSGYDTACGSYTLSVETDIDCYVVCPSGSVPEGEPPCHDGYVDNYNGGCNGTGWTVVNADAGGNADIQGLSGTYLSNGSSYRDTDWYDAIGNGGEATISCMAEFPLQLIFIYGVDCNNLQFDYTTAFCGAPGASLSRGVGSGVHFWPWVAPSMFSGIPCESTYCLHLSGLEPCCPPPEGACCLADGCCAVGPQSECVGIYQGDGTTCEPNPCATPIRSTSWGAIKSLWR
jgi:hypothetical protein